MGRPKKKTSPETKIRALNGVVNGAPYKEIAKEFGFSITTISQWAKAAGLPRRKTGQGIDPQRKPTKRVQDILQMAADKGCSATGREMEISRQRVSSLYKRWEKRGWKPKPSWPPGSWVQRGSQTYVVVEVYDANSGRVMDEAGTILDNFQWRMGQFWTVSEESKKKFGLRHIGVHRAAK